MQVGHFFGRRFGLGPEVMVDVLNASTGMNNGTQEKLKPFVLSRTFNSGFALDLMAKDIGIAIEVAADAHAEVPFSSLCRQLWADAARRLPTGSDHTAIAQYVELLNGAREA